MPYDRDYKKKYEAFQKNLQAKKPVKYNFVIN